MPDPTSHVRFSSVLPKKAWILLYKTNPDPIWLALSVFGEMHLVCKQAGVHESSGPVSGKTQPAHYQFSLSGLVAMIHLQTSQMILSKTSLDLIKFWLNVSGFG